MIKESETVELKRSTSELKEAIISIVAILNKHRHGKLYFGVRDSGDVIGQDIGEQTIRNVSKSVSDHIEPKIFPKINQQNIDGKDCIIVEFEGKNIPYFANGRAYMRIGDEDRQLSAKELETLILKKNSENIRWDSQICENATLDDIDDAILENFVELTKKSKRISIDKEDKELILKKLDLIRNNKLTNASVVLFGKNPSEFFLNNVVKCGRFRGVLKKEFIDMKDYRGNLFDNLESSISFLKDHLRLEAKIKGLLRVEEWEIPIEALRESVINALIHRNYFENSFTYIKMYDSDIVIANPGYLPDTLKISDLYKEHESCLRNPLIANVFYYAGHIDAWGRGSLNIIGFLAKKKLDRPRFEQSGGSFRIIFKRPELGVETGTVEKTVEKRVGERVGEKVGEKLTENQQKIIDFIQREQSISAKELSGRVGISQRKVEENISKLKKKGILKRIGPDKGGHWEIVEEK